MPDRKQLERALFASYDEAACPSADELAAYLLGDLAGTPQLQVASHLRSCPLCQHLLNLSAPPEPRPRLRRLLAQLVPQPFVSGVRSGSSGTPYSYYAADLQVDLSLPPPEGERWRLIGQVRQAGNGLAAVALELQSGRRRARRTTSDAQGFFVFANLPAGHYRLRLSTPELLVEIRDLEVSDDV